jgi:regulatory protein
VHNPQSGLITKIERQQKNKKRYSIYINEEYSFSVHEDVLISHSISKGDEIDGNGLKQILKEEEKKKCERLGLHYLSYRPRTVAEMVRHLKAKEYDEDTIDDLTQEWIKLGYLDDLAFAKQWVEERVRYKKKGRLLLREELKQKGVSTKIVHEVLDHVDQEEEYKACLELAQKKIKTLKNLVDQKEKYKLYSYLQRRGFTFELIQSVLLELEES